MIAHHHLLVVLTTHRQTAMKNLYGTFNLGGTENGMA